MVSMRDDVWGLAQTRVRVDTKRQARMIEPTALPQGECTDWLKAANRGAQ
jgi:hypothetical protein